VNHETVVVTEYPHPLKLYERRGYSFFVRGGRSVTVGEALRDETREKLERYPDSASTHVNGQRVGLDALVRAGDHISVYFIPRSVSGAISKALEVAALVSGSANVVNTAATSFVSYKSFQVSYNFLFGIPGTPRIPRDDRSQVYGWQAGVTDYNPGGLAIPVQYGESPYAGLVVSRRVEIIDGAEPESFLYLLVLLGTGPYEAIGQYTSDQDILTGDDLPDSMLINGNDARNFADVTVSLRLGGNDPTIMAGFESVAREFAVDLPVEQNAGTASDPLVTDWSIGAAGTFPPGVTGDRCTVTLEFPDGLWKINTAGAFKPETVDAQIRYTRVDENGDKVGASVILPSPSTSYNVTAKVLSAFQKQINFELYDPETYVQPTYYTSWGFPSPDSKWIGFGANGAMAGIWGLPGFAELDYPDEFSFFHVCTLNDDDVRNPIASWAQWNGVQAPGLVQGWIMALSQAPGEDHVLELWFGEDSQAGATAILISGDPDIVAGDTFSCGFSYKKDALGANEHRWRLYYNGGVVATYVGSTRLRIPFNVSSLTAEGIPAVNTFPGKETLTVDNRWHGNFDHDQHRWYRRELEPTEMVALHNTGIFQPPTSDTDPDLLWGLVYNGITKVGVSNVVTASTLNNNWFYMQQGAVFGGTIPQSQGPTQVDVGNTIRRDRYIVEVQRTNAQKDTDKKKSTLKLLALTAWLNAGVAYPGVVLAGVKIRATEQIAYGRPNVSFRIKGRNDCPIWDGLSEENPTFTYGYTTTPAWQLAHLCLDGEVGGGHLFGNTHRLIWRTFREWAAFTEELVYDQRGREDVLALEYDDATPGDHRVLVTAAKPKPSRTIVGATVRLPKRNPGAYVFPGVGMEIVSIDETDPDNYVLSCAWPNDVGEPRNVLSNPNDIMGAGWGTSGSAPTLNFSAYGASGTGIASAEFGYLANVGDSITFQGGGESTVTQALTGLTAGESYRVSCYVLILDGLYAGVEAADWTARFEMGSNFADVVVEDRNERDSQNSSVPVRVSAVLQADTTSETFTFGNWDDANDRDVVVWGMMVTEGETLHAFDEAPTTGAGQYPNAGIQRVPSPLALEDETAWVRGGAIPPALLSSSGADLPSDLGPTEDGYANKIGFSGRRASVWQFPALADGDSFIQGTANAAFAGNAVCSVYAKVVDGQGAWAMRFRAKATDSSTFTVADDGLWHRATATISGGTSATAVSIVSRDTGPSGEVRRIALVGPLFTDASVLARLAPYYGNPIAEFVGTEPRIESHLILADRGIEFWNGGVRELSQIGRAQPVRLGDALYMKVQRPRLPVMAFSPSNMELGSFEMADSKPDNAFNSAIGEFQDQDLGYERNTVPRNDASLEDVSSTLTRITRTFDMPGVTNASQVVRELEIRLRASRLVSETCSFVAGPEAAFILPGDVCIIAHPAPNWSDSGRTFDDTSDQTTVVPDVAVTIHHPNFLEASKDLGPNSRSGITPGTEPWILTCSTYSEALRTTIATNPVADPSDQLTAWEITFPQVGGATTNTRVDQFFGPPPVGVYTATFWARLESGVATHVTFSLVQSGTVATVTPTLTGAWARYSISGTSPSNTSTMFFRALRSATTGGDTVIHLAWPRVFLGADDGHPGDNEWLTGRFDDAYLCMFEAATDDLHFARTKLRSGQVAAGSQIELRSNLGYVPPPGEMFLVGQVKTAAQQFELIDASLGQDMRRRLQFVEYNDGIYPDEDEFESLIETFGTSELGFDASLTIQSEDVVPGSVQSLGVFEQPVLDDDTGRLDKSVLVTWSLDRSTASAVDRVNVWARDVTDGDAWELVAQAKARETQMRIDGSAYGFVRDHRYEFAVQPESKNGLRQSLGQCRKRHMTFAGYFPSPDPPVGATVITVGEMVAYRARGSYAQAETAHDAEFVRGNFVIGTPVARVPVGDRGTSPTYDFVDLPANSLGISNPPISVRFVSRDGSVSEVEQLRATLPALGNWPAQVLGSSYEDGPWGTVGTLTGLMAEADPLTGLTRLVFSDPYVDTGEYIGPAHDLAAIARWHIGAAAEGYQVHSAAPSDLPSGPTGARRQAWWTPQGPADPRDPLYAPLTYALQIRTSDTSDPTGGTFADHRPGAYTCRSFQLRVTVTRPAATFDELLDETGADLLDEDNGEAFTEEFREHDVRISRFAVGVRPFPGTDARRVLNPETT